jgi:hypothetical protein
MFDYKFDNSINSLYEAIATGKEIETTVEDIVKDIKNDPKKFIAKILRDNDLNEVIAEFLDAVEKDDSDLGIFAVTLSQIMNKIKK